MVLQRGEKIPVWGRADPNEHVTVTLDGQIVKATADAAGRWRTELNLTNSKPGPFTMTVEGSNRILIEDVVVGEVWLTAGQSNMAFGLEKSVEGATEIPSSSDILFRHFRVAGKAELYPVEECKGFWQVAGPATTGKFSATAYYFGKKLRKELGVPVGLINSAMSSTPIESWMSGEALDADPDLKTTKDRMWSMRDGAPVEGVKKPIPSHMAGALFHGMIQPIVPYGIQGFLWYQGESNASRSWQYRTAFQLMIADWRQKWGRGDLPFYFCQVANFMPRKTTLEESSWAELRESQAAALSLPNTGMAVLIDTEEGGDLHPRNKKDPGERLARLALARNYGKDIQFSGPVFRASVIEGNKVRVSFKHAEGLAARSSMVNVADKNEMEGFAICGADHKWIWAKARIDGRDVLVWSDEIPQPVAVRYAWADNPAATLFNSAGLPAAPFRTDDFPATTQKRKY